MTAANTIHVTNTSDSGSAVVYHALPYYPNVLLDRFAPFSQQPWAMLLHSGFADHPHNRFDIMVADPRVTLCTRGSETEIISDGVTNTVEGDPFILLQQQLDTLSLPVEAHPDFPFQGGALGLFGYDLGRQIETLPTQADQDIDLPDMAIGLYDWALIADHHRQTLTLIVHHSLQARLDWLATSPVNETQVNFSLNSNWQPNMSRAEYGEKFRKIQDYLLAGDCYQVNLAQRFSAAYAGDEWQAFLRLSAGNKAPFSAFLCLPENTVISVSPERFLWLENNRIQTRPIKGTLPRLPDPDADKQQADRLARSKKDRAENLMIVDLLRNDIGRVAVPGSVRVPELFVVEPFPAVHHLVSTIEAQLPENCPATTLLRACFPGGSITGAPKIRAMQIIESWNLSVGMPTAAALATLACAEPWTPISPSGRY
ncbi:P-aminobenzoate synthetase [Pectobacterium parmentieri]|uniref:p-aminobenzoate synthetase n=1 Tax=Pectobacterium parmentieri TaxID=1905730 RepID=A0A0H3I3R8_PECPM|nr:P-aminobenzoate synthetase [Pectobacterium parmentieri]